jgi:hypothetical protein
MEQAHFCRHRSLRLIRIALVAGALGCTFNVAYAGGSAHWQDQVTITGSPATGATAGQAYSFTPSANATSGRTLVFAISNKPSWATFSSSSGQLWHTVGCRHLLERRDRG